MTGLLPDEVPEVKMKLRKNLNQLANILNSNQTQNGSSVSWDGLFSLDSNLAHSATGGAVANLVKLPGKYQTEI